MNSCTFDDTPPEPIPGVDTDLTEADHQAGAVDELDASRRDADPDTFGPIMTALRYLVINTPPIDSRAVPGSNRAARDALTEALRQLRQHVAGSMMPGLRDAVDIAAMTALSHLVDHPVPVAGLMRQAEARQALGVPLDGLPGGTIIRQGDAYHVTADLKPVSVSPVAEYGTEWPTCRLITVHDKKVIRLKGGVEDLDLTEARQLAAELLSAAIRAEAQNG